MALQIRYSLRVILTNTDQRMMLLMILASLLTAETVEFPFRLALACHAATHSLTAWHVKPSTLLRSVEVMV